MRALSQFSASTSMDDLVDVDSRSPKQVAPVRPVGHQPARFHEPALFIHARNGIARHEIEDARAVLPREWFRCYHQRFGAPLRKLRKHGFKTVEIVRAGVEKRDLELIGGSLGLAHAQRHAGIRRVPEDGHAAHPWHQGMDQLEPFCAQV
jgi:hypothetical protein